jgi:hypothetical protein
MRVSHRRATVHGLSALAFSLVVLTGCSGEGDEQAADATPETSQTSSGPADGTDPATDPADETDPATDPVAETDPTAEPVDDTDADDTSGSNDVASWAGTGQFVQIEDARTSDGQTYLSVRLAQKEAVSDGHLEGWVIVPGEGSYTEVALAEDAEVLLSAPLHDESGAASFSPAEFVSRLTAQSSFDRSLIGYDLVFDEDGQVTRVESLYRS